MSFEDAAFRAEVRTGLEGSWVSCVWAVNVGPVSEEARDMT